MAERWSSQENIKFVNLYREQENLWNVFDSQYKNRDARRSSLQHIAKEMNIEGFSEKDVTKNIKNLRSTYNQELLKIGKSKKSGSGTDDIYKLSIKWFEVMDYIMKVINLKEKKTTTNLETDVATEESLDESQSTEDINEDESVRMPTAKKRLDMSQTDEDINRNAETPTAKKMTFSSKKGAKRNVASKESSMHAAINELKDLNRSLRLPIEEEEHECDIIGKHVAIQLKQLPVLDMLDANTEIQSVIKKYRLKNLYSHNGSSTPRTTTTREPSDHSVSSYSRSPPHLGSNQSLQTRNTADEISLMENDNAYFRDEPIFSGHSQYSHQFFHSSSTTDEMTNSTGDSPKY